MNRSSILRDAVVFTVQDLLGDPPFSRLDLISCRNVLIYLQPSAQEQVLSLFQFALRAGGVLFLGRSETVGQFKDRFEPINKKQHIYRHLSAGRPGEAGFRVGTIKERLAPAITPALLADDAKTISLMCEKPAQAFRAHLRFSLPSINACPCKSDGMGIHIGRKDLKLDGAL